MTIASPVLSDAAPIFCCLPDQYSAIQSKSMLAFIWHSDSAFLLFVLLIILLCLPTHCSSFLLYYISCLLDNSAVFLSGVLLFFGVIFCRPFVQYSAFIPFNILMPPMHLTSSGTVFWAHFCPIFLCSLCNFLQLFCLIFRCPPVHCSVILLFSIIQSVALSFSSSSVICSINLPSLFCWPRVSYSSFLLQIFCCRASSTLPSSCALFYLLPVQYSLVSQSLFYCPRIHLPSFSRAILYSSFHLCNIIVSSISIFPLCLVPLRLILFFCPIVQYSSVR